MDELCGAVVATGRNAFHAGNSSHLASPAAGLSSASQNPAPTSPDYEGNSPPWQDPFIEDDPQNTQVETESGDLSINNDITESQVSTQVSLKLTSLTRPLRSRYLLHHWVPPTMVPHPSQFQF